MANPMKANDWLMWFVPYPLFGGCLYFGAINEIAWAQYILVLLVWLNLFVYIACLSSKAIRSKFHGKQQPIPNWISNLANIVFFMVMISSGWYLTSAVYLLIWLCIEILYGKIRIRRPLFAALGESKR